LALPHRRLLKEGPLVERSSRTPDRCYFLLFNDLLLYVEKVKDTLKFKCSFQLGAFPTSHMRKTKSYSLFSFVSLSAAEKTCVESISDRKPGGEVTAELQIENALLITDRDRVIVVCAATASVKAEWLQAVSDATAAWCEKVGLNFPEMETEDDYGGATRSLWFGCSLAVFLFTSRTMLCLFNLSLSLSLSLFRYRLTRRSQAPTNTAFSAKATSIKRGS
jgi:hypothetical protein